MIAAAGYMINDYFDVKTDKINHPETVVVDVVIKRRWVMVLHIVFNAIGLLMGIYLALKCHHLSLLLFQIVSILLLWFYSTHFKKQLLVGNLVVSVLTATIPVMPMVYEYYLYSGADGVMDLLARDTIRFLIVIVFAYSAFAFLTSMAREVIKDMEDYKGDVQTGCKTMPIVWGIITSKVVTFFTILICIGLLLMAQYKFYKEHLYQGIYYIGILVIIPLIVLLFLTIKARTSKDFKVASLLLKFVMLSGIGFTVFIKYLYE